MSQADFVSFDPIKREFPQPKSLKITEVLGIRMKSSHPRTVFTRLTHEPDTTWDAHELSIRSQGDLSNIQLQQMYNGPLAVAEPKKRDLIAMLPYLQPQYRSFYQDL